MRCVWTFRKSFLITTRRKDTFDLLIAQSTKIHLSLFIWNSLKWLKRKLDAAILFLSSIAKSVILMVSNRWKSHFHFPEKTTKKKQARSEICLSSWWFAVKIARDKIDNLQYYSGMAFIHYSELSRCIPLTVLWWASCVQREWTKEEREREKNQAILISMQIAQSKWLWLSLVRSTYHCNHLHHHQYKRNSNFFVPFVFSSDLFFVVQPFSIALLFSCESVQQQSD